MQDILRLLAQAAGIGAFILVIAAATYFYRALRARRESRSALFGAERQSAADRSIRAFLTAAGMLGFALVLLGVALLGQPQTASPVKPTATLTPTSTRNAAQPVVVTFTPAAGSQPTLAAGGQPTLAPTLPPVAPSDTPTPTEPTPTGQTRQTAVVSGVGENLLKLRREPMTTADILAQYPDGTVLEILAGQQTNQGLVWQQVRDAQGNEGWVANQYLVYSP